MVKKLCKRFDALYIADEVQTGLMRTGVMWWVRVTHELYCFPAV
jgi:acetylornithine/succinyldiaminopimelate/putrescine aminotransferase